MKKELIIKLFSEVKDGTKTIDDAITEVTNFSEETPVTEETPEPPKDNNGEPPVQESLENQEAPKVEGAEELTKMLNFSDRCAKIKMHFGDITEQAKEYAFTLAKEVFQDKADKSISDSVAENALKEGGDDEGKIMGIIKNSYCSH